MADAQMEGRDFSRPPGWRFAFEGVNLRDVPDALPPSKFASAKNVRATATQSVQTRPGYTLLFSTGGNPVTDLQVYAAIETDDDPRFLARDTLNGIYLDTGTLIYTMTGTVGYGISMLPFRPSQSPQAWMYIASLQDYRKFSAPDSSNAVTVYKVGIAEPQIGIGQIAAAPEFFNLTYFTTILAGNWTAGGTASGVADGTRSSDTAGLTFADSPDPGRWVTQVSPGIQYQIGESVILPAGFNVVQDVLPPVSPLDIQSIRYDSGTTGNCTITPNQGATGVTTQTAIAALRRNALVDIGGTEIVRVLGTAIGFDGSLAFQCNTTLAHVPGESLVGVPAIVLNSVVTADAITAQDMSCAVATGIGTLTSAALSFNAFVDNIWRPGIRQDDQYLHVSLKVSDPSQLQEIKLLFNVDPTIDYQRNYYYYSIQPSQIAAVAAGTETQLQADLADLVQETVPRDTELPQETAAGVGQWTSLFIPIPSLIRVGGDQSLSLGNCNGIQVVITALADITFSLGDIYVCGDSQPDVGDDGADYQYRLVPRNSVTGVTGNPSPVQRFGVRPRRQRVRVGIPSASYDTQIDTWDVYRYGGAVTSYRYIGSSDITATYFVDNFSDDAARSGKLLETDNFEPWPSIDTPFRLTSAQATITLQGPWITVSGFTAWPAAIDNWLPGTLIQIGGQSAYTLRNRPVQLSATAYAFEIEECITPGAVATYFWILEPKVANNPNPYQFGPDSNGTFFGVGDVLRPGTLSFSKAYGPDSVPDRYNMDLCPPSETLIGGVIKGGVAIVASTRRWWALYPQFQVVTQRYNPIEQSVGRAPVSPWMACDGTFVYFWGRDGIYATGGDGFKSLTDADLYNLFPHEGIAGENVTRNTVTYYAPDYSRAAQFRLGKVNRYLYADYIDTGGNARTLVCDLRTMSWQQDIYADPMRCHFGPEQQIGTLTVSPQSIYPLGLMGAETGEVMVQDDCEDDNGTPIDCLLATFEWDGGDQRAQPLFGDSYLDCVPFSQISVTPTSLGTAAASATVISAGTSRVFQQVSMGGGTLLKYLGLQIEWSE